MKTLAFRVLSGITAVALMALPASASADGAVTAGAAPPSVPATAPASPAMVVTPTTRLLPAAAGELPFRLSVPGATAFGSYQGVKASPSLSKPAPSKPAPNKPAPNKPGPGGSAQAKPVQPKPGQATTVQPKPGQPNPIQPKPVQVRPVRANPVQVRPVQTRPTKPAPDKAQPGAGTAGIGQPAQAHPGQAHAGAGPARESHFARPAAQLTITLKVTDRTRCGVLQLTTTGPADGIEWYTFGSLCKAGTATFRVEATRLLRSAGTLPSLRLCNGLRPALAEGDDCDTYRPPAGV